MAKQEHSNYSATAPAGRIGGRDDALLAPAGGRAESARGRLLPRAARFCSGYRLLARISSADDSDEGGQPIARCTLRGTLAQVWPSILATQQN